MMQIIHNRSMITYHQEGQHEVRFNVSEIYN